MKKVIGILSGDEDLIFLKPLTDSFQILWEEYFEVYLLETTQHSHEVAQKVIAESENCSLIIILCHGGSSYILGNKNIEGLSVNEDYYEFLGAKNVEIAKGKNFISISCNSKDGFGNLIINNGGICLVGFGDIRFDDPIALKKGPVDNNVCQISQREMIFVLTETFKLSIRKHGSLTDFVQYFKLIVNKHCDKLILENRNNSTYKRVANFLWHLKHDITLFGDGSSKIFESKTDIL
jgi:hypothetical protein